PAFGLPTFLLGFPFLCCSAFGEKDKQLPEGLAFPAQLLNLLGAQLFVSGRSLDVLDQRAHVVANCCSADPGWMLGIPDVALKKQNAFIIQAVVVHQLLLRWERTVVFSDIFEKLLTPLADAMRFKAKLHSGCPALDRQC